MLQTQLCDLGSYNFLANTWSIAVDILVSSAMAEAEDDACVFVHHHRVLLAIVQQAAAPCATALVFVGEGDGDLRVGGATLRQLVPHLYNVDVATIVAARISLILIAGTNLQRLLLLICCILIEEEVLVVADVRSSRSCTAIRLHTVSQPDVTKVRFDPRLVLVRLLGVLDAHNRCTDMIVGEDLRRSVMIVVACDVRRVIEIDMAINKETSSIRRRPVIRLSSSGSSQVCSLSLAVVFVAFGREENQAVAVVIDVCPTPHFDITALRHKRQVADFILCASIAEVHGVFCDDVPAGVPLCPRIGWSVIVYRSAMRLTGAIRQNVILGIQACLLTGGILGAIRIPELVADVNVVTSKQGGNKRMLCRRSIGNAHGVVCDNVVESLQIEVVACVTLMQVVEGCSCGIAFTCGDVMPGHEACKALVCLCWITCFMRVVVIDIHVMIGGKPYRRLAFILD